MAIQSTIGTRVRERRAALGLKQADLAMRAGISPSYLNLIEHNRRRLAPDLLDRLAAALGLAAEALQKGPGGALVDDLRTAAIGAAPGPELDRIEDFAARFPGWAALLTTLNARNASLGRAVEALNDRMTHDPHLSANLHEVLSAVASVRSTAAILADTDDIEPEWRDRFLQNLHQDSERLALGAEALVSYLDAGAQELELGIASPQEEVEAWAAARNWDLAVGEEAAEGLATPAARGMAVALLRRAAEDRLALPDQVMRQGLVAGGHDPLAMAARAGVAIPVAFRRLALRPQADVGLVLCDASGTLTLRKPLPGFALPRFGAACPLWPLFTALARPATPIEATMETPGPQGRRFRARAWCQPSHPQGFRGPELREAAMLILPEPVASFGAPPPVPVGSTCRTCPRDGCAARREPSILSL
jgi:transcriptional regulator with XRE-family HTH domain